MPSCVVCSGPLSRSKLYCARCKRLIYSHHLEYSKKRQALQNAWSSPQSAFLCHFSHLPLEELDRDSPFAIEFDHLIPIPSSELVASASFINQLKGDLTADELREALFQLSKHWQGGFRAVRATS